MTDAETRNDVAREVQGGALFFASAFPFVLVLFAWIKYLQGEVPGPDAGGAAALARAIVDAAGYVPPLVVSAGFAAIGAWMLLGGKPVDAGRHLAGILFTGFGLAVVLGSMEPVHGGTLGASTGGWLAGRLGSWAGTFVGVVCVVLSVYFAWLRGRIDFAPRNSGPAATFSDALSEKDGDGVSAAEASALVPDASTLAYMEDLWRADAPQLEPLPPSPYPDDVRRRGEVPEGATPLHSLHAAPETHAEPDAPASEWRRSAADVGADLPAGEDLAAAEGAVEEAELAEPEPEPAAPARTFAAAEPVVARPITDEPLAGLPKPAWEQPDLFVQDEGMAFQHEPDEPDEVEEVAGLADDDAEELDETEEAAELEDEEAELEVEEGEYEDDEEAAEYEEDEDDEEPDEEEAELEDEEGEYEDEDEAAEYEEDEEGEEPDEEEAELEDEEGEYEDEDEAAEYEEDEEGEEPDEEAAELQDEDDEYEDEEEAAEYEEDEGDEESDEEEAELEDEEEAELEDEELAENDDEDTTAEVEEVVLQPQGAPPAAESSTTAPAASREQLVHESGLLFLEHGRVAVSLLQRRFGLDFDEACEILDELQEQGLIGPYMGGQRRDILLTVEDWKGRVAQS